MKINFDKFTVAEIYEMIDAGKITEQEVIAFYKNEWWDNEFSPEPRYDYDRFTTDQINEMIDSGQIDEEEVTEFFKNKWLRYINWPTRHIF